MNDIVMTPALKVLSDLASQAHARIQADFSEINPVVGINQGMRASGFPADIMTIDCLSSGKRIILILHDDLEGIVRYQFAYRDKDPADDFEEILLKEVNHQTLYDWMKDYFSDSSLAQ